MPLALVTSHAVAVTYLTYIIGLGLYRSHTALGPAQDTRQRISQRRKLTAAFGSLAAFGLTLAASSTFSYLTLSYRVWASQRGIELPTWYVLSAGSLLRWIRFSSLTACPGSLAIQAQTRRRPMEPACIL